MDADIRSAVQASIKHHPMDVKSRSRDEDTPAPVGLQNVGNTCYFNSLLQALFLLPNLTKKIFLSKVHANSEISTGTNKEARRKSKSQKMIIELRMLFAQLMLSNQKYVDPSGVMELVVDDNANPIDLGEQMDLVEYLLNFIDRLQEGLSELKVDGSVNDVSMLDHS